MTIHRWFARKGGEQRHGLAEGHHATAGERSAPVQMTGTTTFGADALQALFRAHGQLSGGLLELPGLLVPEPDNPVEPKAVAVHVEGVRIGYLPGYLAGQLSLSSGDVHPCRTQMWGAVDRQALRVVGWVAAGTGPVSWPHASDSPPAITVEDQRRQRVDATREMVDDALTGSDPKRAADFEQGLVDRSYHYLETVEPIKELKRQGRVREALALCYGAIEGAERDRDGREPAPWYTEQAAIIHRKLGEHDQEVAVLRRWLAACPEERRAGSRIQERLAKVLARG